MTRRICSYVPLGILLALPGPALAQKYTKKALDMQGVSVPRRAAPQPKAKAEVKAGPVLTLEEFTSRKQASIQKYVDKQIAELRRLIALASPDDPSLPDYWFRLGELQSEKYRYWINRARSLDEKIFRAKQAEDAGSAEPEQREQKEDEQKAGQSLLKAVSHFTTAARYPRYERMDEVLYRLGYLLRGAGHEDQAREIFHRLLKDHPQSRYVPDAYLAFADDSFAKGDMAQALVFYGKVTQFPQSAVFGFALYKKAWSQANLSDYQGALATFVELIVECQAGRIGQAQRGPLEKEARRDLVKVYARTPGADPDRAPDFFRRLGGDEAPRMLQSLAEIYWEEGMAKSSSRIYRKVMAFLPQSPSLCAWQDKVLRNTLSAGTEPEQVQELVRLGASWRYLQKLGSVKPDVLAECRNRYHDISRELAFVLHKQAQRTRQPPTYQLAAAAYREFLGAFEAEPAATAAAFYYAECLWQIAAASPASQPLWREAAEQYTHVIALDDKSPYVKEAAYAAVLAWQNALYENPSSASPRVSGERQPSRRLGGEGLGG
jgi:tetratricopeptide (TPR) repeat protein